ncbi:MAG: hypothetical protein KAI66_20365 [Lentisphaeria bacterium]|nr:hypothetical protein [Lentisphaeria bacterium]
MRISKNLHKELSSFLAMLALLCCGILAAKEGGKGKRKSDTPGAAKKEAKLKEGKKEAEKTPKKKGRKKKDHEADLFLDKETLTNAKEVCPELLEKRIEIDTLYREFRSLALTTGLRRRKGAIKEARVVGKELTKDMEKLEKAAKKKLRPLEREREKRQEKERRLLSILQKLQERERDTAKIDGELDKLGETLETLELKVDTLIELGEPLFCARDPDFMLLERLIEPNLLEEGTLRNFAKSFPKLVQGRIYIENLTSDLKRAEEGDGETPPNPEEAERLTRKLKSVSRKYGKVFREAYDPIATRHAESAEIAEEAAEVAQKKLEARNSGKYQQALAKAQTAMEGQHRKMKVLQKFVYNTPVEDTFRAYFKKGKKGGKGAGKKPGGRKKRR